MTVKEFYANRVVDFLKKHGKHVVENAKKQSAHPLLFLKQIILKHIEYNTIVIMWDEGEIIGVCAFNIDGDRAHIVECIVHPKYRFKDILKRMTRIGFAHYPYLKELMFDRLHRNDGKKHFISIAKFLRSH